MADINSVKEQKLAAARKKLQQYRKRKGEERAKYSLSREASPNLELNNIVSETSSSRSSSIADISDITKSDNSLFASNGTANLYADHQPYNQLEVNAASETTNNCVPVINVTSDSDLVPCQIPVNLRNSDQDVEVDVFTSKYQENSQNIGQKCEAFNNIDSIDNEGSVCSETNASMTTVIQVRSKDPSSSFQSSEPHLKSTTESLRQLSLQMSGLVNDAEREDPSGPELTILELERRNNELAALLENERQTSMQQSHLLIEYKNKVSSQETQIQALQSLNLSETNGTEVNGLRGQLQVHIQTIGILVAEKSELQSTLSHTRHALEQKNGEVTELQGRLDASRQRVREFEAKVQELENQASTLHSSKESDKQQLLTLQTNFSKSSKMCEEFKASVAELTERLAVKSEENQRLNQELSNTRNELEMAQVHIQQLRGNSGDDLRKQIEQLQITYTEAQSQIQFSKTALEQVQKEKLQIEYEYKTYTNQLASEMESLREKLKNKETKYEELEAIRKNLEEKLISEESKQIIKSSLEKVSREKEDLMNNFIKLQEDKKQLEERCSRLNNDNGQLSQLLSEQSVRLETLEASADRNSTQQVDTNQLLQTMQSDKIAAARALTQNKQLKEQLEELQNGFIMMSNKKLELTEKLEKELYVKKTLHQEIAQLGNQITSLKEELLMKQREIGEMCRNRTADSHIYAKKKGNENILRNGPSIDSSSNFITNEATLSVETPTEESAETEMMRNGHLKSTEGSQGAIDCIEVGEEVVIQNKNTINENESIHPNFHRSDSEAAFKSAHEALEKKFFICMKDLAAVSDEKQNLEHLVQQLQLETDTVGDYITIYQFQRGVMKQQMLDLKSELDNLKTEKEEMVSKLNKLQKLFGSLAADNLPPQDSLFSGIREIMDSDGSQKGEESTMQKQNVNGGQQPADSRLTETQTTQKANIKLASETSKSATVRQIIDLISEMETSSQLDLSALHKFHPCPHCSGKLLTI